LTERPHRVRGCARVGSLERLCSFQRTAGCLSSVEPRAARSLIGWEQKRLAEAARLHPGVMNRMEKAGKSRVGGTLKNLNAVIDALEKAGVEITGDGVRLLPRGGKK